jgi:hypothetical protein
MKRKPKKRTASKPAKKATESGAKLAKSAQKRKPTRGATAKGPTASAGGRAEAVRLTKTTKAKQPVAKHPTVAARNGAATTRAPKPGHDDIREHAHVEHGHHEHDDESGINIGGYDENEDIDETYTEEEEEYSDESEEDY